MEREFLKVFSVYDLLKYEAIDCWDELKLGTHVKLKNQDGQIVVTKEISKKDISKKDISKKEISKKDIKRIGVLSKQECECIRPFVAMNWAEDDKLFECLISEVKNEGDWDQRIKIVVHVKEK